MRLREVWPRLGTFLLATTVLLSCAGSRDPRESEGTAANHTRPAPRRFARCVERDTSGPDGGETTDGGLFLPLSDADRVIASLRPQFRRCYEAGLATDRLMEGCVVMNAQISPEGEVMSNETIRREGLSPKVEGCLIDVVKRARFTAPGGSGAKLHIPLTFLIASPRL